MIVVSAVLAVVVAAILIESAAVPHVKDASRFRCQVRMRVVGENLVADCSCSDCGDAD